MKKYAKTAAWLCAAVMAASIPLSYGVSANESASSETSSSETSVSETPLSDVSVSETASDEISETENTESETTVPETEASASDTSASAPADTLSSSKTGFVQYGNDQYYYIKGKLIKDTFAQINGNYYYFLKSGKMAASTWAKIKDNYYYFGSNGVMYTGWKDIDGKSYYFGGDGKMRTGKSIIYGVEYTFDSAGVWDGNPGAATEPEETTVTVPTETSAIFAPEVIPESGKPVPTEVTFGCTPSDVVVVKKLTAGNYAYKSGILYYSCKFMDKNAYTYYFFEKDRLVSYVTAVPVKDMTEDEKTAVRTDAEKLYTNSYGECSVTSSVNNGKYWDMSSELLMTGCNDTYFMVIHLQPQYADSLFSGTFKMKDILK